MCAQPLSKFIISNRKIRKKGIQERITQLYNYMYTCILRNFCARKQKSAFLMSVIQQLMKRRIQKKVTNNRNNLYLQTVQVKISWCTFDTSCKANNKVDQRLLIWFAYHLDHRLLHIRARILYDRPTILCNDIILSSCLYKQAAITIASKNVFLTQFV